MAMMTMATTVIATAKDDDDRDGAPEVGAVAGGAESCAFRP